MPSSPSESLPPLLPPPLLSAPTTGEILWGLFFNPGCIFQVDGTLMWRGLRLLALAATLGGLLLGGVRYPALWRTSMDWTQWFAGQTGAVRLVGGNVQWDRPATLPYVTRHDGWRVEFQPRGTPAGPAFGAGPERQGIWITPDSIKLWWQPMEGRILNLAVLERQKIWGVVPVAWAFPEGLALSAAAMPGVVRHLLWQMLPVFLVQSAVAALFEVLLYTLLFALIPILLRQPAGGGWRRVLAFYAFAAIPAVVMATVYAAVDLPFLDFGSAFVFAFVIYLLLAMRAARQAAAAGKPPEADDTGWF